MVFYSPRNSYEVYRNRGYGGDDMGGDIGLPPLASGGRRPERVVIGERIAVCKEKTTHRARYNGGGGNEMAAIILVCEREGGKMKNILGKLSADYV